MPHHATVLELVPDGVCMVWVGFLMEPLEVVHGRPRLTLVATCGGQDVPHTGATQHPVVAIVMVGCGRGPLKALPAPLSATLDTLPAAVDGDVGRRSLAAARGRLPVSLG
jgi:hypothetical protein